MLCGWRTHSDLSLTAVPPLMNDKGDIDVAIHVVKGNSPIEKSSNRLSFQHSTKCSIISIQDVADFEIREGRQILIWPTEGTAQKDIEIFLLGPVWATLCHQRGILPLHASAIVSGKTIVAFAGHSGTGKSTTAAMLNSLGYELIADDILPVSFDQNSTPGAWPYLRRLKLHRDPITQLALTPTEVVGESVDSEKYFVHPKRNGDDKWRKLEQLYLLENDVNDSSVQIERLTGMDAVRALVDQTYHFAHIIGTRQFGNHLSFCTELASKILIYRLPRSQLGNTGEKLATLILSHRKGTEA
jgi:hypothetical protein